MKLGRTYWVFNFDESAFAASIERAQQQVAKFAEDVSGVALIRIVPTADGWEGFTYHNGGREAATGSTLGNCLELLAAHHGMRASDFLVVESTPDHGHGHGYIFQAVRSKAVCGECKGTGKYVGLQSVDPCGTCGGSGRGA